MKPTEQTIQQLERAIRKVCARYPQGAEAVLTDIHIQVRPDTGDVFIFDDNEQELMRIVVDQWIEVTEEEFMTQTAAPVLRKVLVANREIADNLSILRPYSWVLENEDHETLAELFLSDEENLILDSELLKDLDEDLDSFLKKLLEE